MPRIAFMTPGVFRLFKYSVYLLLSLNVVLFFRSEWIATDFLFRDGVGWADIINGFAATIDTAAWVVLLLMFELETFVLPDEKITGRTKRALEYTRAVCYAFIVYAFYGYVTKCIGLYAFLPAAVTALCPLADGTASFMTALDEFAVITAANCNTLSGSAQFFRLADHAIFTDPETLKVVRQLAWTDVINAGTWLLVVAVLELDVRLQLAGRLDGRVLTLSKLFKALLYSILLLAAIYWWIDGDFLDFWDALLWILAFVFIELNVFEWQHETTGTGDEAGRG